MDLEVFIVRFTMSDTFHDYMWGFYDDIVFVHCGGLKKRASFKIIKLRRADGMLRRDVLAHVRFGAFTCRVRCMCILVTQAGIMVVHRPA